MTPLKGLALAAVLVSAACGPGPAPSLDPGPSCVRGEKGTCLPVAPTTRRVDLAKPAFTHPTPVTNPLHPTSVVAQAIYLGRVDGKPFRTEVTPLAETKTIGWNGQVDTLVQQYVAYLDGRVHEVALDWYAQADDGSVWYFGEDVFNYEDGVVADTEGTWLAGKDGPAAMIMPAKPKVGDVYRAENIPAKAFEEITVKAVGQTVAGPNGPVTGAITVQELHMDGLLEEKVFAPGYGEFSTSSVDGDVEPMALATPTDARRGPMPGWLDAFSTAAVAAFGTGKAATAEFRAAEVPEKFADYVPTLLGRPEAAFDLALAALDLRLQYEAPKAVDRRRFDLWARRALAERGSRGALLGDVTVLELIWARIHAAPHPDFEALRAPGADVARIIPKLRAAVQSYRE